LLFITSTNPNTYGRVDILEDGTVGACIGDAGWISLDTIRFFPSSSPYTFTNVSSYYSNWVAYGFNHATPAYSVDIEGRTILKGLVKSGTTADGTNIYSFPSSLAPKKYMHITNNNNTNSGNLIGVTTTGFINAKGGGSSYDIATQAIFYPASYSDWTNLVFQNGWVDYDVPGYGNAQFTKSKDGLVSLRGLIKNGTVGAVIATLPQGYRPSKQVLSATASGGSIARLDIDTSGNIWASTGYNGWYSLDGITFYADQ